MKAGCSTAVERTLRVIKFRGLGFNSCRLYSSFISFSNLLRYKIGDLSLIRSLSMNHQVKKISSSAAWGEADLIRLISHV